MKKTMRMRSVFFPIVKALSNVVFSRMIEIIKEGQGCARWHLTNHSTPLRRWKVARSCLIGLGHVPWPRPLRWASLGDIHAVWETFVVNHLEKILKVGTFANFGDNFWMKFGVSGNLIRKSGLFLQRCASSCLLCLEKSLGDGRAPHRELGCDFNVRALWGATEGSNLGLRCQKRNCDDAGIRHWARTDSAQFSRLKSFVLIESTCSSVGSRTRSDSPDFPQPRLEVPLTWAAWAAWWVAWVAWVPFNQCWWPMAVSQWGCYGCDRANGANAGAHGANETSATTCVRG